MSSAPLVVVDSSVAVKWFVSDQESHVAEAWELLSAHHDGGLLLAAPTHLLLEVLTALKRRGLAHADLTGVVDALETARLEWWSVDADLARASAALASEYALTLYDAAFAALAGMLAAELVTADRELAASGACRMRLLG